MIFILRVLQDFNGIKQVPRLLTKKGKIMKKIECLELAGKLLKRYETQHESVRHYYGLLAY